MRSRLAVIKVLGVLLALGGCRPVQPSAAPSPQATVSAVAPLAEQPQRVRMPEDLSDRVAEIREEFGVPGLGAAVFDAQGLSAIGVDGRRRFDVEGPLQTDDKFHLGSDTKAMTAFLVGRLVEQDVLSWDTSLGEVFRDSAGWMNSAYRGVTITQLLRHRAGVPSSLKGVLGLRVAVASAAEGDQRQVLARGLLALKPVQTPGAKYLYSNLGYILAGAVLEHLTHKHWEALMQAEVFAPLGMGSCGFGPTATASEPDGVWAHTFVDHRYEPTEIDNPPFFGPAATVHCSLGDWGKFGVAQFDRGETAVVSADTLDRLHTGVPRDAGEGAYALGWLITERPFQDGGRILTHDGSNTVNYASIVVVPERKVAMVVACNAGGKSAQMATVKLTLDLMGAYAARPR